MLAAPASAEFTADATEIAPLSEFCAACTKVTPLERLNSPCSAVVPGSAAGAMSPKLLVFTLDGCVVSPISCSVLPASVMAGGTAPEDVAATLSAKRPAHPVVPPPCG